MNGKRLMRDLINDVLNDYGIVDGKLTEDILTAFGKWIEECNHFEDRPYMKVTLEKDLGVINEWTTT